MANVHVVHTLAGCSKQCLKVQAAMPIVEKIGSVYLCNCRFVKGKSVAQIIDEHWLDCLGQAGKLVKGDRLNENRGCRRI